MVVRLDMLPLRYMLMHALILGGAIALTFHLPELPCYIVLSLLVVLLMLRLGRSLHLGLSSSALMVFSMALAALITQLGDVPSKDTLELLWGSPFTISIPELILFGTVALFLFLFTFTKQREISIVFFDRELAKTILSRSEAYVDMMVILIALTVALAMRFVGALLIDALLLLPVIIALPRAGSLKGLFTSSSLIGLCVALAGYFLALVLNLPPGASVALVSVAVYLLSLIRKKGRK